MDKQYKENFIKAGALAKEVRAFSRELIKPGASYNEVLGKIYAKIHELGAIPAFPPQIALDTVAAHFLMPPGKDVLFSKQVVKLDIGVCYKGAIGDCAVTVDLSGKYQTLVDAVEAALLAAEKIIAVDLPVRTIGKVIDETIASYGYTSIKNLAGHGLGPYKIHTPPSIPNFDDKSSARITPGMTFAIEPFATNGKGLIYEVPEPMIFSFMAPRLPKSESARALLPKISSFQGLPFSMHDLIAKDVPYKIVQSGIAELLKAGVIAGYGPLREQGSGMVAQAENSVLVDEDGAVIVTTR